MITCDFAAPVLEFSALFTSLYYANMSVLGKVGRITSFGHFEPQHAMIIKDKDEVSCIYYSCKGTH